MLVCCNGLPSTVVKRCTMLTSSIASCVAGAGVAREQPAVEEKLLAQARMIVPSMTQDKHKGEAGRIGVIGGSVDYTGAPYFAAISALRVGCDLAHVFCMKEAAPIIKSYSPELIVHPVLDSENAVELIKPWLPRLHVLVIGPGMGRDPATFNTVSSLINLCRSGIKEYQKPLIIDADGLFMVTERPHIIQDYPNGAILTPNAVEFSRLSQAILGETWKPTLDPNRENVKKVACAFGSNVTIIHKGRVDVFAEGSSKESKYIWECTGGGTGRRCGGQGDLLSGSLGTFYAWSLMAVEKCKGKVDSQSQFPPSIIASYAGCRLARECNTYAFAKTGRSTLTSDMINVIQPVFEHLFGECFLCFKTM